MVTADNLNLDVLEHLCSFLSGNDLPAVAQVSSSFFAAVVPSLYHTISYRLRQSKGYHADTISPFAAVLAHPALAVHVRKIEIRAVPSIKNAIHPVFIKECKSTLAICRNLTSFTCLVSNAMPVLLPSLHDDKPRLRDLRVSAVLTLPQAEMLLAIERLSTLSIEFASWNVVDKLPEWTAKLSDSLLHLTLYMLNDLNEPVLKSILSHLPSLLSLHVVGCPKIDHVAVFRQLSLTPHLESLALTSSGNPNAMVPEPSLRHLKHLAIDARYTLQPSAGGILNPLAGLAANLAAGAGGNAPGLGGLGGVGPGTGTGTGNGTGTTANPPHPPSSLLNILHALKPSSPPLTAFTLRHQERKAVVSEPFVDALLEGYGHTLRSVAFLDSVVGLKTVEEVCERCVGLERLDVPIPIRDLTAFARALSHSHTLTTLVDSDTHVEHGIWPTLNGEQVRDVMLLTPSLRKIVTKHRIWTGQPDKDKTKPRPHALAGDGRVTVALEKRPLNVKKTGLWFVPRD